MGDGRRQILWFGVTATIKWIANQLTEAFGWEQISRYLPERTALSIWPD